MIHNTKLPAQPSTRKIFLYRAQQIFSLFFPAAARRLKLIFIPKIELFSTGWAGPCFEMLRFAEPNPMFPLSGWLLWHHRGRPEGPADPARGAAGEPDHQYRYVGREGEGEQDNYNINLRDLPADNKLHSNHQIGCEGRGRTIC